MDYGFGVEHLFSLVPVQLNIEYATAGGATTILVSVAFLIAGDAIGETPN
jgi:hypothetical protein